MSEESQAIFDPLVDQQLDPSKEMVYTKGLYPQLYKSKEDDKASFGFSFHCLRNINFSQHPKDFSFIFNNMKFECPLIMAEFISPLVSKIRKDDASIKELKLDYTIKDKTTLDQLSSIMYGNT